MAFVRHLFRGSLEAQQVNNPPANKENESATHLQGHFLGQEEPLEEVTVTPSSILAWRVPLTDEPGRLQTVGSQRVCTAEATEHRDVFRSANGQQRAYSECEGYSREHSHTVYSFTESPPEQGEES